MLCLLLTTMVCGALVGDQLQALWCAIALEIHAESRRAGEPFPVEWACIVCVECIVAADQEKLAFIARYVFSDGFIR